MIPGWSPTKVVQMVLIGCISRSRGQKIGFQNAIFKYLLVWNFKAQNFQIWYIASSRSFLPIFGYNNIMASPWPLTFSSGERPRALWALLFCASHNLLWLIGNWGESIRLKAPKFLFFSFKCQWKEYFVICELTSFHVDISSRICINRHLF